MIFKGIAKKPYIFVIFQSGPLSPSGSALAKLEALAMEDEANFLKLSTISRALNSHSEYSKLLFVLHSD